MKVTPFSRSLAYVLVADADQRRTEICLQAAKVHGVGALVARHHDEAMGALRDFGAPLLLIADLLLPPQDGFTVIETARRIGVDPSRTRIMAWAAAREVREFAACRLASLNVRILAGSVPAAVITGAIGRLLSAATHADPSLVRDQAATEADQTIEDLATRAREISATAGVAVYLKSAVDQPFRSASTWLADEPVPASLDTLPITLQRIIETPEAIVALDLESDPGPNSSFRHAAEGLRGFVAVPITDADDEVAGMICVFDGKPLTLGEAEVDALKALGHHGAATRVRARPLALRPHLRAFGGRDRANHGFALQSSTQPLTLLDRHEGSVVVTREMARARREQNHLSVVVLDVDADSGGLEREAIDDPIESAGHALTRVIRGYDLAIRWSRQELVLVLPGVGGTEAGRVAERVLAVIQSGDDTGLAVAGGVAELEDDSTLESIVERANEQLRHTKEQNTLRS